MREQRNIDIRNKAKDANLKLWELAEALGMADTTFSRLLRMELSEESKEYVFSVIEAISNGTELPAFKGVKKLSNKSKQKPAYTGYLLSDSYQPGNENFKTDILET